MPVKSDPTTATAKWVTNLSNSTTAIQRGVANVTTSPGQAAAAAADKWLAKVTASQAKWKARVGSVQLGDWQNAMNQYGIPRIAQGAQAKQGKMLAFQQQWLPFLATQVQKIDAMPKTTLEDGVNRAVAMIRANATFKRTS